MNRRAHLLGIFKDNTGGHTGISPCSPDSADLSSLYGYTPSTLGRSSIMFPRARVSSVRPNMRQDEDNERFMKRHERVERKRLRGI